MTSVAIAVEKFVKGFGVPALACKCTAGPTAARSDYCTYFYTLY